MMDTEKTLPKILNILKYVGTIGALLMMVAYISIVCVMVFGFKSQADFTHSITFALINAIIGFIIMQFLKIQGIDIAKNLPENEKILKEYYGTKTKDKKAHSITYFWIKTVLTDIVGKSLSIMITTFGIIYIVIQGSNDYSYLLLALVNLILFCCFGLLSLVNAYEFYNNENIPYIKEQLKYKENKENVYTE